MTRKIVPIATILLAIGLLIFLRIDETNQAEKTSQYNELYEQRRPLEVKKEDLEQELLDLEKAYEESKSPNGVTQIIFTELDKQVYTVCYPLMKEYGYVGVLALSPTELPGEKGCMSQKQFQELIEAGWDVCITWQEGIPVEEWWTNLQNKLMVLGIEKGQTLYFPKGMYNVELDEQISQLGFTIAMSDTVEEEKPLQFKYEEGVWHIGAVGLMSSRPKLWLREAVAQDANIAYLVGFDEQKKEELYNPNSFQKMLEAFGEYEDTGELIVTSITDAREHYYRRIAGLPEEVEFQYQSRKAEIEKELNQVKAKLKEIDAMY